MSRRVRGWLYIVENPAMPNLVKIGGTGESVRRRVRELFTTGVPEPFRKCLHLRVTDWRAAETAVHRALAEYRHVRNREFFAAEAEVARAIALRICAPFMVAGNRTGAVQRQRPGAEQKRAAEPTGPRPEPRIASSGWRADDGLSHPPAAAQRGSRGRDFLAAYDDD